MTSKKQKSSIDTITPTPPNTTTTTTTTSTTATTKDKKKSKKPKSSGLTKVGADIIELQASLLNRPARKQATHVNSRYEDHDTDTTEYNIWYHKKLGNRNWKDRDVSETRCNVLKDCGKTRANKDANFCCYFARGKCINGADCTSLHRIPTPEDDKRLRLTHDIFGRERHKTDRDDMNGVGSFSRDNRTLYIGGIKTNVSGSLEDMVRKNFEEWGRIEYVRVITNRSISFVRYLTRSSAEFAKEAMTDQTLDNGELLNIRWATEDSNPYAKKVDERNLHRVATEVINKRIREMTPDDQSALKYQMTGQYPNTDQQYDQNGQPINASPSTPYQLQYRGSTKYEAHPYARQYNNDLQKRVQSGETVDVAPLNGVGNYYSHSVGTMNQELQKQQYDNYMQQYYQAYGYDYSKLSDDQKLQLQQYFQSYYYGNQQEQQQQETQQIQNNNENNNDNEEEDDDDEDDDDDNEDDDNDNEETKDNKNDKVENKEEENKEVQEKINTESKEDTKNEEQEKKEEKEKTDSDNIVNKED
ncbi:pre-mRNA-splicing factor cwc2 [Dictyostelium discoideum AX4]|uniref:Pre-mRNA-splicing factor cwc2 n=1 Tax=Dictyostelium discoideum TaxID=44689 RepID=CWC2_DICDI|nr:pre-mRNA-splicing factor cwc2 [Dictyostelium discoideum AX4]Q54PH5.1 RecName: Full=Pre-mRNA-splicing factor cwc2 [Dictyostelium discoideum]EAL65208.1 pre-mRNA-splicing factor cwc2 [Dictyostelium discoideum AX4]|eukprot:XP_638557.1 pre-mRNA-splicing factor cwc2 [Dictyostelium discoideum AX4]